MALSRSQHMMIHPAQEEYTLDSQQLMTIITMCSVITWDIAQDQEPLFPAGLNLQ